MTITAPSLSTTFVWRRARSLTGLWLVGFLIIHLLANSQAALLFGENGSGFVKAVNDIHDLPYLPVIELTLLGLPFLVHILWGINRLFTCKLNSISTDGTTPSLIEYPRNQAYTWQRVTSWILLIGITAHVIHMRFLEEPTYAQKGSEKYYMVRVNNDPGLIPLSARLGFEIFTPEKIQQEKTQFSSITPMHTEDLLEKQKIQDQKSWVEALTQRTLGPDQLMAVSKSYGIAELLMVRDTFKLPIMLILYTLLVIFTCFHAFNGLWTFLISWGVSLSVKSQRLTRIFSTALMFLVAFLGLAAIWGTYWINLKQ